MILIPAIDLSGSKCVRLAQGRFDRVTVYGDDPLAVAQAHREAGAVWLHVVDLDAARDPARSQTALVLEIARRSGLAVQAGGGIRTAAQVRTLIAGGVARVVVGSLSVKAPELARELLAEFGGGRLVFALDVRIGADRVPRIATSGWRDDSGTSLWQALATYADSGLRTVLCTDIARDGMLCGPNLELYRELRSRWPRLEIVASGGVAAVDDLRALRAVGVDGVIVGKALYERRFTLAEALAC